MKILNAIFFIPFMMLSTGAAYAGSPATSPHNRVNHYFVINLPSLGGTTSQGDGINDQGLITGFSFLAPNAQTVHAAAWLYGLKKDLGTLGGPNSAVLWPVKDTSGLIVGISQTSIPDPLEESWSCAAFIPASDNTCVGFVWRRGQMHPLPTLGGNNGFVTGANNRGRIVGWAETDVEDSTCVSPQVLQFRAVVWGPGENQIQELPSYLDDPDSAATAINNRGQVVGISGTCDNAVGEFSAAHAVLWQPDGTVVNLGSLGGVAWNTPMAINNHGVVVGFSDHPGDEDGTPNFTAFVWTERTGMQDLYKLHGDSLSEALDINDHGQIVGTSIGATATAILWEDGKKINLNKLVQPGYPDQLLYAQSINNAGIITGAAYNPVTQKTSAFVAIPVTGKYDLQMAASPTQAGNRAKSKVQLPAKVRQMVFKRLGLGIWPQAAEFQGVPERNKSRTVAAERAERNPRLGFWLPAVK